PRAGRRAHVLPAARGRDEADARNAAKPQRRVPLYVHDRRVPRPLVLPAVSGGAEAPRPGPIVEAYPWRGREPLARRREPIGDGGRAQRRARRTVSRCRAASVRAAPPRARACRGLTPAVE